MSKWTEEARAAFDLETTGRDPHSARVVTASIVHYGADNSLVEERTWLLNPGVPIPAGASAIHGISTEEAQREGVDPQVALPEILGALRDLFAAGTPVMAFNAPYDFTLINAEARRHGFGEVSPRPVLDPLVMDKRVDRFRRGNRTLVAMTEHYGVRLDDAHSSAADSIATLEVALKIAQAFAEVDIEAEALHDAQIIWAREQAASFQEYLRRSKPGVVIDGSWPVSGK
ncbi:3'-5' exonuclease [Haematomicrobium sanguinis]|uniref:3'-5' exonuclease n=1 Tax=Haematomicrobium sanguinis TaxID=479106 RepID=UPI00047A5940|nr:3'-5' exonuclease [Haematomicrobium sanguinis]